jgi:hypothetical protein
MFSSVTWLTVASLILGLAACSSGPRAGGDTATTGRQSFGEAERTEYTVGPIVSPGRVTGTVHLTGDVPADTTVHPTNDTDVCGTEFVDTTFVRDGDGLGGVVVWLVGVTAGKAMPYIRRHDIANDGCRLTPRVQAVPMGGTLNIRSLDRVVHRNRLKRVGAPDSASVLVTENDEGQVIPLEGILSVPGMVEVRCDQHPWTRGWIAVFAHPYFTVTKPDGSFALDSVPPGHYRLMTWHERTGASSRDVVVDGGGTAEMKVEISVRPSGGTR